GRTCGTRWLWLHGSWLHVSTRWVASPIAMPRRSSSRQVVRPSGRRSSARWHEPLRTSASTPTPRTPPRSHGAWPRSGLGRGGALPRPGPAGAVRAVPAWIWLTLIVAASTVLRAALSRKLPGPFIFVDELIYAELGRSFATGGHFLVRDVPTSGYGVVYPVL